MENFDFFCQLLVEEVNELALKNKHHYIQEVSQWIARVFATDTKKEVTHEYDPPWDFSGQLVETREPFDLENYTTLRSFTEDEYNGQTEASFMSGCGLFHRYYNEDLDYLTREWIGEQLVSAIEQLLPKHKKLFDEFIEEANVWNENVDSAQGIASMIMGEDIIGDFLVFELPDRLRIEAEETNLSFLVKMNERQVKEQIKKEKLEATKQAELMEKQRKIDQKLAEKIWQQLTNRHKLQHQQNLPKKIERHYFRTIIIPILQEMLAEGTGKEEMKTIAQFYSYALSNTVCSDLTSGNF